jgi:hypothetical protein
MILTSLDLDPVSFEQRTGWAIKPQGACKSEVCVPLGGEATLEGLAERLGMPLVEDQAHGVWALGPESGVTGRVLTTAVVPEITLPDVRTGEPFHLSSLKGQKVLLVAWASW